MARKKSTSPPGVKVEGSVYNTEHTERTVKIYPIAEDELETVSELNTNQTAWITAGSVAIGAVLGCAWDVSNSSSSSISGRAWFFIIVLVLAAIGAFFVAYIHWKKRDTKIKRILSQCKTRPVKVNYPVD